MFLYINFDSWTSRIRVRWTTTKTKKSIHFDSNFYYSCRRKLWLCNYIISFNMFRWTYTISTFSKEHDKYCTHIALNFHSLSFQMYRASDPPIITLKHGGLSDRLEFIVYDFPSFYVLAIRTKEVKLFLVMIATLLKTISQILKKDRKNISSRYFVIKNLHLLETFSFHFYNHKSHTGIFSWCNPMIYVKTLSW